MIEGELLPTLAAPQVMLRWLTEADVEAIYAIFSDPEVMRYWSTLPMSDIAQARRLIADIHDGFRTQRLFQWGVARLEDDRIVGTCTLFAINQSQGRAEIGYALGRGFWGRGYMNEALTALLDFAFGSLSMRRLEADVDPRNTGSLRALERLGFRREGLLRERWRVNGESQDSVVLGLLGDDWRSRSAACRTS
ncbi:MAG: GNAT family N-acetyltransferase [Steroidobacteraceae bacterium]